MRESWVGLQAGVDARKWARLLTRAHDVALQRGHVPSIVRGVIADSWERCAETGVDPGEPGAPLVIEQTEAHDRWQEHPLSRMTQILRHVLGDLMLEARHIVVVSDAEGCILWTDGHPDVLRAAERIRFSPGHAWSESAAGTNAVGTTLATDHPVQVFSAEHYRSEIHGWQCSGAPVHDPETGATLGAIDLTGKFQTAHPYTLALVGLASRLVEERLRSEMLERDTRIIGLFAEYAAHHRGPAAALSRSGRVLAATPHAWIGGRLALGDPPRLADGSEAILTPLGDGMLLAPADLDAVGVGVGVGPDSRRRLTLLGPGRARVQTDTGMRPLTARHAELAALLVLHPEGLDSHALAELLYGEPGHEIAVRAELHRLRGLLGAALATRPYRLTGISSDLAEVFGHLEAGELESARGATAGELLPRSTLPAIRTARERLAAELR